MRSIKIKHKKPGVSHSVRDSVRSMVNMVLDDALDHETDAFAGMICVCLTYDFDITVVAKEMVARCKRLEMNNKDTVRLMSEWVKWAVRSGCTASIKECERIKDHVRALFNKSKGADDEETGDAYSVFCVSLEKLTKDTKSTPRRNKALSEVLGMLESSAKHVVSAQEFSVAWVRAFHNETPRALAYELTRCTARMVQTLNLHDFIMDEGGSNAPLARLRCRTTSVTQWLQYLVVMSHAQDARSGIVEKLLAVCDHLRLLCNYDDMFCIRTALVDDCVSNLMTPKQTEIVGARTAVVSMDASFEAYAREIESRVTNKNVPAIPILSCIEIMKSKCSNETCYTEDGKVNAVKVNMAQKLGTYLYQFLSARYAMPQPLVSFQGLLECVPDFGDMGLDICRVATQLKTQMSEDNKKQDASLYDPIFDAIDTRRRASMHNPKRRSFLASITQSRRRRTCSTMSVTESRTTRRTDIYGTVSQHMESPTFTRKERCQRTSTDLSKLTGKTGMVSSNSSERSKA